MQEENLEKVVQDVIQKTKSVLQLDSNGVLVGTILADESPLEPGVFLMPAGCIEAEKPILAQNQYAKWNGNSFDVFDIVEKVEETPQEVELTQEEKDALILKEYDRKLLEFFDLKASEKNYDNRITCSLRAGYPGPFQVEGLAFAQWMDACNAYCYEVIQDIQEGSRVVPSFEQLASEFPPLDW